MQWIKASERLPEKVEDTTKNSYAVKCFNRKDAIYWDGINWFWIGTNDIVSKSDFEIIEWLDESPIPDNQNELWNEVGRIVMDGYEYADQKIVTAILKSKFTISKK